MSDDGPGLAVMTDGPAEVAVMAFVCCKAIAGMPAFESGLREAADALVKAFGSKNAEDMPLEVFRGQRGQG